MVVPVIYAEGSIEEHGVDDGVVAANVVAANANRAVVLECQVHAARKVVHADRRRDARPGATELSMEEMDAGNAGTLDRLEVGRTT